jgi:23S rRNA pseudouridine1911/1915/1917 synthase
LKIRESHTALIQEKPIRFQEYGVGIFRSILSKSALKKEIKKELILINGVIANTATFIQGGESIQLLKDEIRQKSAKLILKLEVCFEDDHLAIINKPAGIVVSGNKQKTIANALPYNLNKSSQTDALTNPLPVHRLDFPTTGLLLVAKTNPSLIALNSMFEEKSVQKIYHAITIGVMKPEGIIETKINGKAATTNYGVIGTQVSDRFDRLNLVRLFPKTGRRHQLRIHLSELGNPILGDVLYGKEDLILKGKGLYLHASSLTLEHPITKEVLKVEAKLPAKFIKLFTDIK